MEKLISVKKLSLNFNLREPKGNKLTNVYCVVKCGNRQFKFSTRCKVNSWQWNKNQQMPTISPNMSEEDRTNNMHLINVISSIRLGYSEYFSYLCNNSETTSENEIKSYFFTNILNNIEMANNENLQKGRSKSATKLLQKAFDIYYLEIKPQTKESSKQQEQSKLNAFYDYCKEIGRDGKGMLSQRGLNDYKTYLIKQSKEKGENGNGNKTINLKCTTIKKFINNVLAVHNTFLNEGIKKVEYVNLPIPKIDGEDKKRRPLTNEEINKLMNADNLTPREKEYRDLFVLECNCSYRVSDTPRLFDKSLQKKERRGDNEFIVIGTKKEGIKSVIWVTDTVRTILERYEKGFEYVTINDSYNRKLNNALKTIFKKNGFDSMESWKDSKGVERSAPLYDIITSHFARYTFINHCFDIGMTANEIIDFSGHSNEKMVNEVYRVRTSKDKIDKAAKTIERLTKKETTSTITNEDNKVKEYKDVLAFYNEPYINYRHINDSEELLRLIVSKYEMRLKTKGYTTEVLKKIYNSQSMEDRDKYERLLKTLDEIAAESES